MVADGAEVEAGVEAEAGAVVLDGEEDFIQLTVIQDMVIRVMPMDIPYVPEMTSQQEAEMLKEQAKAMQEDISSINERIKELESAKKSEGK